MTKPAYTVSANNNVPLTLLDSDVNTGATVRSTVYANGENTPSCSVELHVTLLGAGPVNLAVRMLGQNSVPAADPTRLLPIDVKVPDTSALNANYSCLFVIPVFPPYGQIEVQNVSGGNVHVFASVQGSVAQFVDSPAAASGTSNVAVTSLPSAAQTDLDTLAGAVSGGVFKTLLQAGANAIGKLAANVGINIGTVDVASLPSLVLAAGSAAIGKLAANIGVNIGTVDVASLPAVPAGTNSIGAVTVALPTTPYHNAVTVTAPGTRVQIATTQALKEGVDIEAHPTNTGTIYVGGATVSATNGRRLSAGQSAFVRIADLATIYIDASVAGEGASYLGV